MPFLAPAALAVLVLALPIILLYMLRLRRRDQVISSTLLWRELVTDRAANAPWQRLRRNLLLLLQLLVLLALAFALARPYLRLPGPAEGNIIILLDASASMGATDLENGVTRFEAAANQVGNLIDGVGGSDRITLIHVGRTPRVLAAASGDRAGLRAALASASVENSAADWPAAFALVIGSAQGADDLRIEIFSDGGLPASLPALPGDVHFTVVGRSGDNLALSAQSARSGPDGTELLVAVTNTGPQPRRAIVDVSLDGILYDSRQVDLPAGGRQNLLWTLPPGAATAETHLQSDGGGDYLAIDNRAWTVLDSGGGRRVLLIGDGNLYLDRLFAVMPGYDLFRAFPGEQATTLDGASFDLTVYDSVPIPDPLPAGNLLFIDPQAPAEQPANEPFIRVTGSFTETVAVRLAASDLLANVDWHDVHIADAQRVEAPQLEPIIEAEGGPLLLAGEVGGKRIAVLAFDLRRSDLPLQIAFPVVMANIGAWLSPGRVAVGDIVQPGATVTLFPDPRATTVTIEKPDGTQWVEATNGIAAATAYSDTYQSGLYSVTFRDSGGEVLSTGLFAINFLSSDESHIAPALSIQVGRAEVAAQPAGGERRREFWPWLLLIALALLLVEWRLNYPRPTDRPRYKFR